MLTLTNHVDDMHPSVMCRKSHFTILFLSKTDYSNVFIRKGYTVDLINFPQYCPSIINKGSVRMFFSTLKCLKHYDN